MSNPRRQFLSRFFDDLEQNGIRYCIQRNYDNLYDNDLATDLDMIVSEYSRGRFQQCLREAAAKTGFRFVHQARYVNYSQVFWHPMAGFVRVDFETDVRWRLFTVLTAREVLDARLRHDNFFIPHPAHESVILSVAALWRGELSRRYRQRLSDLRAACADKDFLRQNFIRAFGGAGHALLTGTEAINEADNQRFWTKLRWSLIFSSLQFRSRLFSVFRNLWIDARRLLDRVFHCAGVSLVFVSSNPHPPDISDLLRKMEFLFPNQKSRIQHFDLREITAMSGPVGWWDCWQRWRIMFKGGLLVRAYRVAQDKDWATVLRPYLRQMYSERSFVGLENVRGEFYFAHVKSGMMNFRESQTNAEPPQDFNQLFIELISTQLDKSQGLKGSTTPRPGKFCVLVGLDGAGKTTLARNIARLAKDEAAILGVRYFHWLPPLGNAVEFPLPEPGNQPRKPRRVGGAIESTFSALRLGKNLIRAHLAWRLRLRSWRNRGYLVLVDRYLYNYYLDPVSVKYYGPRWVRDRLSHWFPKPEIVITLSASPEILLQRKQELSKAEMYEQAAVLQQLQFPTPYVIVADATEPADVVAQKVMAELRKLLS